MAAHKDTAPMRPPVPMVKQDYPANTTDPSLDPVRLATGL
jgi:hypothetical protein